jgi:hypothetical protein
MSTDRVGGGARKATMRRSSHGRSISLLSIDNERCIHLDPMARSRSSDRPSSTRHRAHIVNGVLMTRPRTEGRPPLHRSESSLHLSNWDMAPFNATGRYARENSHDQS